MAIKQNSPILYRDVLDSLEFYNIPRRVPKDITSYWTDGTLWDRIAGTNGYKPYEGIHVGDYINMGRPVTCPESYNNTIGSQYVTVVSCGGFYGNGNSNIIKYNHLIMVPGQGFGGTQHFGRHAINDSNTTSGGYIGSKMNTSIIGSVVSSVSTTSGGTINQQLYNIFKNHLKIYNSLLSNEMTSSYINRFGGKNNGASSSWNWLPVQARLMGEVEVYGTIVWSSSGYDIGNGYYQFDLFKYNREAINNRDTYYWLKDIASDYSFCDCYSDGSANCHGASNSDFGVRPCFILA